MKTVDKVDIEMIISAMERAQKLSPLVHMLCENDGHLIATTLMTAAIVETLSMRKDGVALEDVEASLNAFFPEYVKLIVRILNDADAAGAAKKDQPNAEATAH
jgi:hypothetical protein